MSVKDIGSFLMNDRLERIRESEKRSHTEVYTNEKLYSSDGWLKKPIYTVQELMPLFYDYDSVRVLDLGCGVGRTAYMLPRNLKTAL